MIVSSNNNSAHLKKMNHNLGVKTLPTAKLCFAHLIHEISSINLRGFP